ncbi:hypothetical protein BJX76DRAFT_318050 [Aspergillus varians]
MNQSGPNEASVLLPGDSLDSLQSLSSIIPGQVHAPYLCLRYKNLYFPRLSPDHFNFPFSLPLIFLLFSLIPKPRRNPVFICSSSPHYLTLVPSSHLSCLPVSSLFSSIQVCPLSLISLVPLIPLSILLILALSAQVAYKPIPPGSTGLAQYLDYTTTSRSLGS